MDPSWQHDASFPIYSRTDVYRGMGRIIVWKTLHVLPYSQLRRCKITKKQAASYVDASLVLQSFTLPSRSSRHDCSRGPVDVVHARVPASTVLQPLTPLNSNHSNTPVCDGHSSESDVKDFDRSWVYDQAPLTESHLRCSARASASVTRPQAAGNAISDVTCFAAPVSCLVNSHIISLKYCAHSPSSSCVSSTVRTGHPRFSQLKRKHALPGLENTKVRRLSVHTSPARKLTPPVQFRERLKCLGSRLNVVKLNQKRRSRRLRLLQEAQTETKRRSLRLQSLHDAKTETKRWSRRLRSLHTAQTGRNNLQENVSLPPPQLRDCHVDLCASAVPRQTTASLTRRPAIDDGERCMFKRRADRLTLFERFKAPVIITSQLQVSARHDSCTEAKQEPVCVLCV